MRQEAWRAYLEMALGITEASGKKALKTAKRLVGKGSVSAEQLQGLADELVRTSAANREAITNLVRVELERALGALGLAKADEVETLTARVRELEAQLQAVKAPAAAATTGNAAPATLTSPPVKKAVAKKTVAKKATPVVGEPLTAPAPGPAGPEPADGVVPPTKVAPATKAAPAKKSAPATKAVPAKKSVPAKTAKKTTKRTPGSGEPVP
jgi:polyhydroxyalkanoate synthesis regulator phasin